MCPGAGPPRTAVLFNLYSSGSSYDIYQSVQTVPAGRLQQVLFAPYRAARIGFPGQGSAASLVNWFLYFQICLFKFSAIREINSGILILTDNRLRMALFYRTNTYLLPHGHFQCTLWQPLEILILSGICSGILTFSRHISITHFLQSALMCFHATFSVLYIFCLLMASSKSTVRQNPPVNTSEFNLSPTVTRHPPHIPVPSIMTGFMLTIVLIHKAL